MASETRAGTRQRNRRSNFRQSQPRHAFKKMDTKAPNLIPSGIEPVDKLLGGLESAQLYLVHGEAAGKSLFGIKFLIEGLKRGEHGALVIRYSPEDAVRRFARLGYDCLEDVYSGRLVILEYSDDIIQQVSRLRELTPVLRELEWLLGETKPQRLIFDPVTSLVAGVGNLQSRVNEFTEWARSFGATVVFIANGEPDVVDAVKPHTVDVFRFEVKDVGERAARFIAFEKSAIADQAIEVDPSRGIFLLERGRSPEHFFSIFQAPSPTGDATRTEESLSPSTAPLVSEIAARPAEMNPAEPLVESSTISSMSDFDLDKLLEPFAEMWKANAPTAATDPVEKLAPPAPAPRAAESHVEPQPPPARQSATRAASEAAIQQESTTPATTPLPVQPRAAQPASVTPPTAPPDEPSADVFADLIDELARSASPLDIELPEPHSAPAPVGKASAPTPIVRRAPQATGDMTDAPASSPVADRSSLALPSAASVSAARAEAPPTPHRRAADVKIDSAMAARATEVLLRPPDAQTAPPDEAMAAESSREATPPTAVQPKECNVLVIDDDPTSCELIAQTLDNYTLEIVHDGMSGLAKLISFKPDLVVLSLDLPIIDGFKVLEHMRQGLNVPVILITGTRMRASDRVLAAELGADYYITKPYSPKELRHKARQLIARYRGISSWITVGPTSGEASSFAAPPLAEPVVVTLPGEPFTSYQKFTAQVEDRVRATLESNATFAIVGCRLPQMTAQGGQIALRLYDLARRLIRETDLLSTNPRNDIVILLTDANANGARAFVSRLRERIVNELHQEPGIWLRSFPDLEESTSAKDWTYRSSNGASDRRASDRRAAPEPSHEPRPAEVTAKRDPRESYIDFLEQL
jgi:DNA-binding response OmpR family regulator/KaiC/GvpD/RAD55 family RecA-like ATPase